VSIRTRDRDVLRLTVPAPADRARRAPRRQFLLRLRDAGRPPQLVGYDRRHRRLLLAASVPRHQRFGVLVKLLGDRRLAKLLRAGVAVVQAHVWGPHPRGLLVEVIELDAADFDGPAGGPF
jgi:hypothetical protein